LEVARALGVQAHPEPPLRYDTLSHPDSELFRSTFDEFWSLAEREMTKLEWLEADFLDDPELQAKALATARRDADRVLARFFDGAKVEMVARHDDVTGFRIDASEQDTRTLYIERRPLGAVERYIEAHLISSTRPNDDVQPNDAVSRLLPRVRQALPPLLECGPFRVSNARKARWDIANQLRVFCHTALESLRATCHGLHPTWDPFLNRYALSDQQIRSLEGEVVELISAVQAERNAARRLTLASDSGSGWHWVLHVINSLYTHCVEHA